MKFSYTWLKDHLDTNIPAQEIAKKLSEIGFEVEHVEDYTEKLKDITVAQVRSVIEHPNSDHLHICEVDDGSGKMLQIVCGAKNVVQGMKTALVHCGGVVPKYGEALKAAKIRGVESQGMLCSKEELGLDDDGVDGIIHFPDAALVGQPVAEFLEIDDQIFTISITSNRGDCFSVRGIARELAAAGMGKLKPIDYFSHFPNVPAPTVQVGSLPMSPLPIFIETENCPFFVGAVMENVKNTASPEWMQKRLQIAGQRPVDALVDVTNFLNFDIGQPMHVYDLNHIHHAIHIRQAKDQEKLQLLNGQECTLSKEDMIIADDSKPLTVAGIMGGEESGSSFETDRILLEAAYFDPISVTVTGQKMSVRSESRTRFERGIDPNMTQESVVLGLTLIQQICGGEIAGCTIAKNETGSVPGWNAPRLTVSLNLDRLMSMSGDASLSIQDAEAVLNKLGFETKEKNASQLTVWIPSWRHDVSLEVDLIEEVLRMRGYNRLLIQALPLQLQEDAINPIHHVKSKLCARGFYEVYTLPFLSDEGLKLFAEASDTIEVLSPLNLEMKYLRNSLLPSLLNVVTTNQSRGNKGGAIFELESVFSAPHYEVKENQMIAGIRFGFSPKHWLEPSRGVDVFDIKADLLSILSMCEINGFKVVSDNLPKYYHPNKAGRVIRGAEILGFFGEIHPSVLKALDITGPVVGFELFITNQLFAKLRKSSYKSFALSSLQPIHRDFAFIVDDKVPAQLLMETIQKSNDMITYVQVFDVFRSVNLGEGKKSIAVQITLQPKDKTLEDADLQMISQTIIENVRVKCNGEVRSV